MGRIRFQEKSLKRNRGPKKNYGRNEGIKKDNSPRGVLKVFLVLTS